MRIGGKNIAEICAMPIEEAEPFMRQLQLSDWERAVGRTCWTRCRPDWHFCGRWGWAT